MGKSSHFNGELSRAWMTQEGTSCRSREASLIRTFISSSACRIRVQLKPTGVGSSPPKSSSNWIANLQIQKLPLEDKPLFTPSPYPQLCIIIIQDIHRALTISLHRFRSRSWPLPKPVHCLNLARELKYSTPHPLGSFFRPLISPYHDVVLQSKPTAIWPTTGSSD